MIIAPQQPQIDQFGRRLAALFPVMQHQYSANNYVPPPEEPVYQLQAVSPMTALPPEQSPVSPQIPPSQITAPQAPAEAQFTPVPASMRQQIPAPVPQLQPANFAPIPPTVHQEAYQQGLPVPRQQDYQAHGLRRVLNAIAGGFAGAAGHPEVGTQLAERPYEQALADWQRKTGQLKAASDVDTELGNLGVQRGTAISSDIGRQSEIQRRAEQSEIERGRAETAKEAAEAKITATEERLRLSTEALKQKEEIAKMHAGFAQALIAAQTPEEKEKVRAAFTEAVSLTEAGKINEAVNKFKALTHEAATNPEVPIAAAAKRPEIASPTDQAAVQSFVDRATKDPDSWHDIYKEVPAKLKAAFTAQTANLDIGHQITDVTVKTAVQNAKVALGHAEQIQNLINDPEVLQGLGPIAGRMQQARSWLGIADGLKLTDKDYGKKAQALLEEAAQVAQAAPGGSKVAQLITLMSYLAAFEASSVSGTRPSWQLIQYLAKSTPGLRMEPSRMQGAINGVRFAANVRIDKAYEETKKGHPVKAPASRDVENTINDLVKKYGDSNARH